MPSPPSSPIVPSSRRDGLEDLASLEVALIEAETAEPTGLVLHRFLGQGGMSSVFEASHEGTFSEKLLDERTPNRVAVKIMKPKAAEGLRALGIDPFHVMAREAVGLGRLSKDVPHPNVVAFYGCGLVDIDVAPNSTSERLPWLAIELVDGGAAGSTLGRRVSRAEGGMDPVRVLKLVHLLADGIRALHAERIVHRDVKPENVLVAGPIDNEVPKLSDCGIARIEGFAADSIYAATWAYAPFEQLVAMGNLKNPLIGPWTDVHAFAALVWFVIAGEQWFPEDQGAVSHWFRGERRSLRSLVVRPSGHRMHEGYTIDSSELDALDAVLARGAAPRLPKCAEETPGADVFLSILTARYPCSRTGQSRYASIDAFGADLFPILERIAANWSERAFRERRPATVVRPTVPLGTGGPEEDRSDYRQEVRAPRTLHPTVAGFAFELEPSGIAFQADGKAIALSGSQVVFFIEDQGYRVELPAAPDQLTALLATTRVHSIAGLGFVFVSADRVLAVQRGEWRFLPLPFADAHIETSCSGPSGLGLVTSADPDSGLSNLWLTRDGRFEAPLPFALNGGSATAAAEGPYGVLIVGAARGFGRAVFTAFDGTETPYNRGIANAPPLMVATAGSGREAWAAGRQGIVRFGSSHAEVETNTLVTSGATDPVQMALDLVGSPWLVTTRSVLRREATHTQWRWRIVHERKADDTPLAAIGFTPKGARVLDRRGGSVWITPADIEAWRPRS